MPGSQKQRGKKKKRPRGGGYKVNMTRGVIELGFQKGCWNFWKEKKKKEAQAQGEGHAVTVIWEGRIWTGLESNKPGVFVEEGGGGITEV